ncbi:hypothetical protein ACPCKP_17755 [Streptomyces cellulosae]|uniref:hypothetical protein n=1 Tax=Streptomyces sp. McG7 TaxID=2725486 RepID=UPI001BEA1785|nr:hypothetical protein [Streptomyces sp. McG7]
MTEREPELVLCREVAGRASTKPSPSGVAALAALERVGPHAGHAMLQETMEVLAASQPVPAWHAAGPNRPVGAWCAVDVWDSERVLFIDYDGPVPHTLMAHIGEVGGTLVDKLALLTPHAAHAWEGMRGEDEVLMPLVEQDAAEVLADLAAALRLTDLTWPRPDDEEVIALRALAWARCRDHLPDRPEHQPLAQGERARVLDAFEQVGAPCGGGSRHRPVAGRAVLGLRGELPQPRAAVLEPRPDRRLPGDWLPRKTVLDQAHRALLPAVFKRWVTFALTERGVPTPWIAPAVAAVSRHGPRHPPQWGAARDNHPTARAGRKKQ